MTWERRLLIGFGGLAALSTLVAFWAEKPKKEMQGRALADITTHIPKGYVLAPIEVQNYESLDSVLGRFGFVDLYASQGGRILARNVRLLRAPNNPSQFAVLLPEHQSAPIVMANGPLFVMLKRAQQVGTEIVTQESRPRRRIVYGE